MQNHTASIAFALAAILPTLAQAQAPRGSHYLLVDTDCNVDGHIYKFEVDHDSNVLKWEGLLPATTGVNTTYTLPFDKLGGYQMLSETTLLVSGRNDATGAGWLIEVAAKLTTKTLQKTNDKSYGGTFDPWDVAYNVHDGHLYILDWGKRIWRASWTPGTAFPVAFTLIRTATQMAALNDTPYLELQVPPTGDLGSIFVAYKWGSSTMTRRVKYDSVAATWCDEPVNPIAPPVSLDTWEILGSPVLVRENKDLFVHAASSGTFEVVDDTNQSVVFTGSYTTPNAWTGFSVASLVPGRPVFVRTSGGGALPKNSFLFTPVARYGNPVDQPDLTSGVMISNTTDFQVSSTFPVGQVIKLTKDPIPQNTTYTIDTYVHVALRDAQGNDPVIESNGVAYISNPLYVIGPFTSTLDENQRVGGYLHEEVVPADPSLAGNVVLWQFVHVSQALGLIASDVYGTTIHPTGGPLSLNGSNSNRNKAGESKGEASKEQGDSGSSISPMSGNRYRPTAKQHAAGKRWMVRNRAEHRRRGRLANSEVLRIIRNELIRRGR